MLLKSTVYPTSTVPIEREMRLIKPKRDPHVWRAKRQNEMCQGERSSHHLQLFAVFLSMEIG